MLALKPTSAPRRRPNSRLRIHALDQVQDQIGAEQHDHPEHHAAGLYGTRQGPLRPVVAEDETDEDAPIQVRASFSARLRALPVKVAAMTDLLFRSASMNALAKGK